MVCEWCKTTWMGVSWVEVVVGGEALPSSLPHGLASTSDPSTAPGIRWEGRQMGSRVAAAVQTPLGPQLC